jgi:hypothetical protein
MILKEFQSFVATLGAAQRLWDQLTQIDQVLHNCQKCTTVLGPY